MIGPKTREFAEIDIPAMMVELLDKASTEGLIPPETPSFTINYSWGAKLAMIARLSVKKNIVTHPRFIFGDWWFLHYQAWLWKLSQKWRENVLEYWLKDLDLLDVNIHYYPEEQEKASDGILINP